jgi:hypothetical protein
MRRIPEPELMDGQEQARAYAEADFSEPNTLFLELLSERLGRSDTWQQALDLGCGPADITLRFARAYPCCRIDAVDGASAMLAFARSPARSAAGGTGVRSHSLQQPASPPSRARSALDGDTSAGASRGGSTGHGPDATDNNRSSRYVGRGLCLGRPRSIAPGLPQFPAGVLRAGGGPDTAAIGRPQCARGEEG